MLQVYEAIMGKPPGKPVLPAAAKRVLAVWDKRASIQGQYVAWQDHVDDLVLLVDACHGCPAEMFARDIRAVGWDAGTDRSRDIKSVLQWKPDRGAGATFDERLDAAREWDAAGRPGTTEDNSREAILRRVSSGEWRGPVMTPEEIESERLENEKAAVALRALVANNNRETGGTA